MVSARLLVFLPATVTRWLVWAMFVVPVGGAIVAPLVYLDRLG